MRKGLQFHTAATAGSNSGDAAAEYQHPADTLALALSRASGILASVGNCFNEKDGQFALNDPFVAHAVKTVEEFIVEATQALTLLYQKYDLSVPRVQPDVVDEADEDDDDEETAVEPEVAVAKTYEELLQNVTEAEVFASEQENSPQLLPLLSSLKEELLRLRSVA